MQNLPEAPEVELVRRRLSCIVGEQVRELRVLDDDLGATPGDVQDRTITGLRRHGKRLAIDLDAGLSLVWHPRMTGAISFARRTPDARTPPPHLRAVLDLEAHSLQFVDRRRLGSLEVQTSLDFTDHYGIDLIDATARALDDAGRTSSLKKRAAKALMLDQRGPVAGAGNYLIDESLFLERVHPHASSDSMTAEKWLKIWRSCRALADRSLAGRPELLADFIAPSGAHGEWPQHLICYGRAGLPCVRCGAILERIRVGVRGGTFCPRCQAR